MAVISRQRFPWREGNDFRLLVDGDEIFSTMLASIQTAQSQIFLEMYLVASGALMDRFIASLSEAVKRDVNVYLLFDGFGSRGLTEFDRQRIQQAGMHLSIYNPLHFGELHRNLLRDHRKLMVVDGTTAFVGGVGLMDVFDVTSHPQHYWHDTAVQVQGPVVADWRDMFCSNWHSWGRQLLSDVKAPAIESPPVLMVAMTVNDMPAKAGRVSGGRSFGAAGIQRSFLKRVRNAERHVWMMTAYFVPSRSLLRALKKAARRGVDVRLISPGPMTDHPSVRYAGHRHYASLLRSGVRIFEYQPRFLHAKVLLCDDWVSLGSSNVDRWNLRWNLEANQEIENSEFAARTRELFEEDFADSEECLAKAWGLRSRYRHAREWFWGKVAQWLEGFSIYLRRRK